MPVGGIANDREQMALRSKLLNSVQLLFGYKHVALSIDVQARGVLELTGLATSAAKVKKGSAAAGIQDHDATIAPIFDCQAAIGQRTDSLRGVKFGRTITFVHLPGRNRRSVGCELADPILLAF